MKLQIIKFSAVGGDHFCLVPLDENIQKELAELGGNKFLEVSDEQGKQMLKSQADVIRFQLKLQQLFNSK